MTDNTRRGLAAAALLLVFATAASRVLGLFREIIMVTYLGLGDEMGAFTVANKIPNLIRALLADTALAAAFVPVFSGLLEKERRVQAWRMAFTVSVVGVVLWGVLTVSCMACAPQIVKIIAPGFKSPEIVALTVHLMRVMLPSVIIMGLAGIFMGILNSLHHFSAPALAPIMWNVAIIAIIATLSERYGFEALAWGVLLGTALELAIQVPSVWRRRWRRSAGDDTRGPLADGARFADSPWRLDLRSPDVRRVAILLGPVILSVGIVNFNSLIDTSIATLISVPAPGIIQRAFRIYQLPFGMFGVAVGTVLLPSLSRHAVAGRMAEFRQDLSSGFRQIFFMTLPFAAFFALLASPTVRVIYLHGKVTPADAEAVAQALRFISVGVVFASTTTLLNRAFYSLQKPWILLVAGVGNLALNAGLDLLLYRPLGVGGITLSSSLVSMFYCLVLLLLLRRQIGRVDGGRILASGLRSVAALVPLAAVSYAAWLGLDRLLGQALWMQVISVLVAYLAGGFAYCLAAWAMHMPELHAALRMLRMIGKRRGKPERTETNTAVQ